MRNDPLAYAQDCQHNTPNNTPINNTNNNGGTTTSIGSQGSTSSGTNSGNNGGNNQNNFQTTNNNNKGAAAYSPVLSGKAWLYNVQYGYPYSNALSSIGSNSLGLPVWNPPASGGSNSWSGLANSIASGLQQSGQYLSSIFANLFS